MRCTAPPLRHAQGRLARKGLERGTAGEIFDGAKRGCCLSLVLAFWLILFTTLAPAQQVKPWNQIQAPPLPAFTPPEPARIQLGNGMVIFLQSGPRAAADQRDGAHSRRAPSTSRQARPGLTELYGEVWRTGGTKTKTGDQMDDFLEARAAKIETDTSRTRPPSRSIA